MSSRRTRAPRRLLALVVLAATAGCASTVQEARVASGGDEVVAASNAAPTGAADELTSPAADASASPTSGAGPGVAGGAPSSRRAGTTAGPSATSRRPALTTPIKVGYTVADVSGIAAALGAATSPQTQATRDVWRALLSHANKNGGVGGRRINGVEYGVSGTTNVAALCVQATEDDHVDAMLDFDAFTADNDLACFARHKTPLVTQLFSPSRELVLASRPYLATTFGLPDRATPAMIEGLAKVGYFNGAKVGVLMDDLPLIKRIWAQKAQPMLDRLGVKVLVTYHVHPTDAGRQSSQAQSAVLAFKSKGVTHVVAAANVLALITFAQASQANNYHARLGLGDYFIGASAAPGNATAFPALAEALRDSVAVTMAAGLVLDDPAKKRGSVIDRNSPNLLPATRRCLDILSQELNTNYYTRPSNERGRGWAAICDSFFLWWETARKVGAAYTRENWGTAIPELGTSHQSSVVHATRFAPTQYDGAADYRIGTYYSASTQCSCYKALLKDFFPLPAG